MKDEPTLSTEQMRQASIKFTEAGNQCKRAQVTAGERNEQPSTIAFLAIGEAVCLTIGDMLRNQVGYELAKAEKSKDKK